MSEFKKMKGFWDKILSGESEDVFKRGAYKEIAKDFFDRFYESGEAEGAILFNGVKISSKDSHIKVELLLDGVSLMVLDEDIYPIDSTGNTVTVNLKEGLMRMTLK